MLRSKFAASRGAQKEFAKKLGCSESHLSLVLSGERGLSYELATRLRDVAGISIDDALAPPLVPQER
jgi:transcriptional regulator with XRE-family HTH domain